MTNEQFILETLRIELQCQTPTRLNEIIFQKAKWFGVCEESTAAHYDAATYDTTDAKIRFIIGDEARAFDRAGVVEFLQSEGIHP